MISKKMQNFIKRASWIRKMFEEGIRLKKKYGPDNVFDFSLGNPHMPPPDEFYEAVKREIKGGHGYTENAGLFETREIIASYLTKEHGIEFSPDEIILTCGAAGGLNVIFKALLNPEEEVIVPVPFFMEYAFYIDNHGGKIKTVKTKDNFNLDLKVINDNLNLSTKAIVINSPNNPTGQVYLEETLKELAMILESHRKKTKKIVYLILDEPYRKIVYDNIKLPSIFQIYSETIVVTSFSKDLSLAGERIGYLAIHPHCFHKAELIAACILANRILGFVNAPVLMQRVIKHMLEVSVDSKVYEKNRDLLCEGLSALGFSFILPKGAFYLFPKAPIADDISFVQALQKERILAVPGSGFGTPGYFRLAFCVKEDVIKKSMPYFEKVAYKFGLIS